MKFLEEILTEVEGKEEIIEKIKAEVGTRYVPKTDFNSKNDELKVVKEQLSERDTQLEELKGKAKDSEELTSQIEALQELNNTNKTEYEERIAAINKDIAIEKAIATSEFNFIDAELVKTLVKSDDIKINDDGIIGLKEQLETIAEQKPFLRVEKEDGDKKIPNIITNKSKEKKEPGTLTYTEMIEQGLFK